MNNDVIEKHLEKHGWYRDRKVNIDNIILGIVYGNSDEFVTVFGNSFYEALYNIINLKTVKNFIV
jgi:hypothetical protein